jgi:2-polyprenyl-3-methyl-5-hydroxy-6-metoxy-1,4-benzoquinol methylase
LQIRVIFLNASPAFSNRRENAMSSPTAHNRQERDQWLGRSRKVWNERASRWDAMLDEHPEQRDGELQRVIAALGVQPGMRLLDAGCGSGQWAVGFAEYGSQVTAIDLSPSMLSHARQNAAEAGVDIEFREGDIAGIEDPEATYDVIHCRCSLQFNPDPVAVLRVFQRILKPEGRLFVAVPGALSPIYAASWRRYIDTDVVNNHMLPWELEALLEHLGWQLIGGWGMYMEAASGAPALTLEQSESLPRALQQATSTFWATIATREIAP